MRAPYRVLITVALLTFFFACKKEKVEPTSPSFQYFPTDQGRYVIYNVDSTVYTDSTNNDSIYYYHYQLKDVIDTPFIDGEGKERQVVIRYYRADTTQNWSVRNIYTQLLTLSSAYRWEDNIPYHKLSFPFRSSKQWNGNDMNTLGEELYSYQEVHQPQTFNNFYFDSTVTVFQGDPETFDNYIERIYGLEVYAEGVGLVFKVRDDLRKTANIVVSGSEYVMTVAEYGKE